jgi:hypothetical protein
MSSIFSIHILHAYDLFLILLSFWQVFGSMQCMYVGNIFIITAVTTSFLTQNIRLFPVKNLMYRVHIFFYVMQSEMEDLLFGLWFI